MARKSRKSTAETDGIAVAAVESAYKTAIYARLSVEDSGKNDDGDSIENQIYLVKQYIEERPYLSLCGTFIEMITSSLIQLYFKGSKPKTPKDHVF